MSQDNPDALPISTAGFSTSLGGVPSPSKLKKNISFITHIGPLAPKAEPHGAMQTFGCIALNIGSAVGIVMANKVVFAKYDFVFGTVLTVIHFLVTSIVLVVLGKLHFFEPKSLPFGSILPLSASFCGFVVLTNLSLQFNSVGFYQMAKVMTTPCVALIQKLFYNVGMNRNVMVALSATCIGVTIATVTEINLTLRGFVVAVAAIIVTSVYQVWVGAKQKELEVNAMQLLYCQAPVSAIMLACLCPFLEDLDKLAAYKFTRSSGIALVVSALLATLVNVSTFLIIGRSSAITYNVVGHCKLSLVLLLGYIFFDSTLTILNLSGVFMALMGIIAYSFIPAINSTSTLAKIGSKPN